MNKPVVLREVAIIDLRVKYARDMGGNKVRHYVLPMSSILANHILGANIAEYTKNTITEFIRKEENDSNLEVRFEQNASPEVYNDGKSSNGSSLALRDITDSLLKKDKDILRALKLNKTSSTLRQRVVLPTLKDKILAFVDYHIINNLNYLLYKIGLNNGFQYSVGRKKSYGLNKAFSSGTESHRFLGTISNLNNPIHIPNIYFNYYRIVEPCRFLTVAFENNNYEEAKKSLLSDLRILTDKKLLNGHLSMPFKMALADTVGVGPGSSVIGVYIFLDEEKLAKQLGYGNAGEFSMKNNHPNLHCIGIANETIEGSINWLDGKSADNNYEIEEICVDAVYERNHDTRIDLYLEGVDTVNAIAKKQSEAMKECPLVAKATLLPQDSVSSRRQVEVKIGKKE